MMKCFKTLSYFFLLLATCGLTNVASQDWVDCDKNGSKECNHNGGRASCVDDKCKCTFGYTNDGDVQGRCDKDYDPCVDENFSCPRNSVCVKYAVPIVYRCACDTEQFEAVFGGSPVGGDDPAETRLTECIGPPSTAPSDPSGSQGQSYPSIFGLVVGTMFFAIMYS
mmetsp:Transcript_101/g.135  ORF Transcript_101/g.135 Transcript_101/m.135 type:complete len:167 (+) Transcript_101:102-602(+)